MTIAFRSPARLAVFGMVIAIALAASPERAARADDPGPVVITSAQDLGSDVNGRRRIRLYGDFPGTADLFPTALCNGRPTPIAIEYFVRSFSRRPILRHRVRTAT